MILEKTIAIAGKPGLYKLVEKTRVGFVAESLIDENRLSGRNQQKVSVLSEIAMYKLLYEIL